jgi:uncharacterized protein involved in exopolysaccharide biosynthesis
MEEEVDLIGLLKNILKNKNTIIKCSLVFLIIGILYGFSLKNEYTSSSIIVLQTTSDNKPQIVGSMAGIASLAGVNFSNPTGESLQPQIYPKILNSSAFQKELLYSKFLFSNIPDSITLYDFYTSKKYKKFNLISSILDYSIGLPSKILDLIKNSDEDSANNSNDQHLTNRMTLKEQEISEKISSFIMLVFYEKEGYITIKTTTNDPLFSYELVEKVIEMLQKNIITFKIEKAKLNLEYVEKRYNEEKRKFEDLQTELAILKDENRNINSERARIQVERVNSDYTLHFNLYSELAIQVEKAKIKVTETSPVLTIIDPPLIPNLKSGPHRLIVLFLFSIIGFVVGCGYVFAKPYFIQFIKAYKQKA